MPFLSASGLNVSRFTVVPDGPTTDSAGVSTATGSGSASISTANSSISGIASISALISSVFGLATRLTREAGASSGAGVSSTTGSATGFFARFLTRGGGAASVSACGSAGLALTGAISTGVSVPMGATTSGSVSTGKVSATFAALIILIARLGAVSVFGKYLLRTFSAMTSLTELDATLTSAPSRRRSSITRFVSCLTSRARS